MDRRSVPFGALVDGRAVRALRLAWPGGLELELLDYGAVVRSLRAPAAGGMVEAVLGFPTVADYEADRGYQGCIVGRCANRIAGATFSIDGERFEVAANEGANCLHGGALGFSKRLWRFVEAGQDGRSATLAYDSPDGEEGFPGRVQARVAFALTAADTLTIVWEAETDRPTPVNLTHHLYFNLSGGPSRPALDHSLAIAGDQITPVRPDLIPTGERMDVAGTPFDLRSPRPLAEVLAGTHPQLAIAGGIDHNWVLREAAGPAAVLRSPETGLSLQLSTDQPGLQVYGGQGLSGPFAPYGGVALEPQGFPDAVNQPRFPSVVLAPGHPYRRSASYRFVAGEAGEDA
ncbi:MAG TPA: aldose epimerase family protein [Caulobacteraceae bacterium]|jgi:aldose 1-epimerase|nr:aldose epimerase family protein [Caulobacteraceae bacterium]